MYISLRNHSYYSFLRGVPAPAELAHAAARANMPALALTDYSMLSGAIEFYADCLVEGVQPVLGLEVPVRFPYPNSHEDHIEGLMVLLSYDLTGWSNLCRISSQLQSTPDLLRSLTWEDLARNTRGLICLTGGWNGLISRMIEDPESAARNCLRMIMDLFPERTYIELQPQMHPDSIRGLFSLAQTEGLPVVATNDVHFLSPDESHLQRVLTAIRLNQPLTGLPNRSTAPEFAHFATEPEMASYFSEIPEALKNTVEIADRCHLELPLGQPHYPQIDLPPQQTPVQALRLKAEEGALRHFGSISPSIQSRLDSELDVIDQSGYAVLFMVMQEIVHFARENGIPFSSRGSAASSLVAYCLGITSPDPLRLNLYFERFLNPARVTPPDIDIDLCSRRRDEVIEFVYQKFGHDRVAMVSTVNRFRSRSALREAAKAYGLSLSKIKALAEALPRHWYGPPVQDSSGDGPYGSIRSSFRSPEYENIFRDAASLLGKPRHLSLHPGGMIITPGLLTDLVPTLLASKGVIATQFDLESLERLGLVKLDLLGIRGLTVLGDVAQAVQSKQDVSPIRREGRQISVTRGSTTAMDWLNELPENDQAAAALVREGRTIGCFQIESPGMRATLREIRAENVDDIMVALALFRPGPLTGGLKQTFVHRHRGEEAVDYLHPALIPLLQDTYGVILYQEQVLRIAHELAGLSLSDSDLLRRAMSHFDPGKQMQSLKERFIAGAFTHSEVSQSVSERIWDLMAAFAGYGFPKAHAASYAQVAWRSAWCKAHYPAIFLAAVLANWGGYFGQRVYLTEARRMGLKVRPPHVNYSQREFSVIYTTGEPVLYMGLDQVRDLTRRTQSRIQRHRPFQTLADFLTRVDPRPVEAKNLIKVGALEGFGSVPALLQALEHGPSWRKSQLPLFPYGEMGAENEPREWPLDKIVATEEMILGASVTAHPLDLISDEIEALGAINTLDAASQVGKNVRIAGMRQTWRRAGSTRGGYVYFMSVEDLEGSLNTFISSEIYRKFRNVFSQKEPFLVEGVVELDPSGEEPILRIENAWLVINR